MIVCICHGISHREIERHAPACDSFAELQMCTGVATGCGHCGDCARSMFDEARQARACGGTPITLHRGALSLQAA